MFRTHQTDAVEASVRTDFASGVHFHATGTGKSWVALRLLLEFQTRNPKSNVLWICEQKSILVEQFSKDTLKSRGFEAVYKTFLLLDYSIRKPADWVQQVQSASIWGKPLLVIVNRAFLTSSTRYEHLKLPIHLVIHDECHSITNATTQAFYKWILGRPHVPRCIGFSATPVLTLDPYKTILSSYTIYDACRDGTIVPPRIVWVKKEGELKDDEVRALVSRATPTLPYKKIIVWCGMITAAQELATSWSKDPRFAGWMFAMDTTAAQGSWSTYEDFFHRTEKAFLFCASKHREGSDIPFLDACVFLDRVANRNAKTFLQCMGRVLRRDLAGRKTHGLVLDLCAASSIKVCDRIHQYIHVGFQTDQFPFQYSFKREETLGIHLLEMTTSPQSVKPSRGVISDIETLFVRPLPEGNVYKDRLRSELDLLKAKDLMGYIGRALDILDITRSIPHVTRGSCGSSLVCYMLGISHVDPVRWNIRFARFLNEFRSTLPDIDFDFPHVLRDEVFLQIQMMWPGKVARISNHVYYHKKSAVREALRHVGVRKQIPALQLTQTIRRLTAKQQRQVHKKTEELENTFKGYSLHCGGIVFYPDGVPKALTLGSKHGVMSQITLNKEDVAKERRFKIDILSSRALSQLMEARRYAGLTGEVAFDAFLENEATAALFQTGDNIGLTLAESPLIRKAFLKIKPSTVDQVALCLALIRPAARKARVAVSDADLDAMFVYDDDAIEIVARALKCSDAEADRFRRGFAKGDKTAAKELQRALRMRPAIAEEVMDQLANLRKYSFCKSHAFSYAQLVWQLAYMKAHYPVAFWRATLKHNESMYRKWVHLYEARCAGVEVSDTEAKKTCSIYAEHKRKRDVPVTAMEQLRLLGVWSGSEFFPGTYMRRVGKTRVELRGLIASARVLNWQQAVKKAVLSVGVAPQTYMEVVVSGTSLFLSKKIGITCVAERDGDVWKTEKAEFW
jgi:hypothetical protein